MLSPEVSTFPAPSLIYKVKQFDGKVPTHLNFNYMVTLIVPNSLRLPEQESLFADCEYYKIRDLNIHDLIDITFFSSFVRNGGLTLLSVGTHCGNNIAITPGGLLTLEINKDTYHSLGIEGVPSKTEKQYLASVDLTDGTLISNQSKLEKIRTKLKTLRKTTVIISWQPPEKGICPSSVAKFFSNMGYSVEVCNPKVKEHTVYSVKCPSLWSDENEIHQILEWLGMMALEGDVKTNAPDNYVNSYVYPEHFEDLGQVKCLQWTGLFTAAQLQEFYEKIGNHNDLLKKPWVAIYVKSFSDIPEPRKYKQEYGITLRDDNGYVLILNKTKTLSVIYSKANKF